MNSKLLARRRHWMHRLVLALIVALVSHVPQCWGQHSDIEVQVEQGGLVTIPRIVEGEFGEAPNPPNVADEPGFEIDIGVFQPNEVLGFDVAGLAISGISRHLWYWDGTGPVVFGATPDAIADHQLSIEHPLLGSSVRLTDVPGAAGLPGFVLMAADATGFGHQDVDYRLVDPSGNDLAAPAAGVYLFGLEMTSPAYTSSPPIYFVFGAGVDEVVTDMAIDEVAGIFGVPEPVMGIWLPGTVLAYCIHRLRRAAAPIR